MLVEVVVLLNVTIGEYQGVDHGEGHAQVGLVHVCHGGGEELDDWIGLI